MGAQLFMFPESKPLRPADAVSFDLWWAQYPHRVAKGQARRAWGRAIKQASFAELLAGVERYKADKPADIPWCNPATWLNGERWLDQPATNRRSDPDLELKARARTIARGLPCPNATRQQVAEMVRRGLLTEEHAAKAGFSNGGTNG